MANETEKGKSMGAYELIPIDRIQANPKNPRKSGKDPASLQTLVDSIKANGILEPIIVRLMAGKAGIYEIIAGERRYWASKIAEHTFIPAIVRTMTDDEAYETMMVENIMREDLTDYEESASFAEYLEKNGPESITALSVKTGIRQPYILSHTSVLKLEKEILEKWKKGAIRYEHCRQLMRVPDKAERLSLAKRLTAEDYTRIASAAALKSEIDGMKIALYHAKFDAHAMCGQCISNTDIQTSLFGFDAEKASCLNPKCFKKQQGEFLKANWEKTRFKKEFKTNGFIFTEDARMAFRTGRNAYQIFYDYEGSLKPNKECFACHSFLTICGTDLRVDSERVCINPECFHAREKGMNRAKKEAKGEAPAGRVSWHGEYFRDQFFRPRVIEKIGKLNLSSVVGLAVLAAAALKDMPGREEIAGMLGLKSSNRDYEYYPREQITEALMTAPPDKLVDVTKKILVHILMNGRSVDTGSSGDGFGTKNRALVAAALGVDIAKEFAVTEEYLKKKTKTEIVEFGIRFDLWKDERMAKYFAKKKITKSGVDENTVLKKSELIDAILNSGVDLVGKVPDEIKVEIDSKKFNQK